MGLGDLKEVEDYFGIKREPPAMTEERRMQIRWAAMTEMQRGMVVGAAIIAWAEAIRANGARGRCPDREAGGEGVQCELREGHTEGHACPEAIRRSFGGK